MALNLIRRSTDSNAVADTIEPYVALISVGGVSVSDGSGSDSGSRRLLQLQQDIVFVLLSTLSQHLEGEELVTKLVASFAWAANDYGLVAPITKGTIPMQNITGLVIVLRPHHPARSPCGTLSPNDSDFDKGAVSLLSSLSLSSPDNLPTHHLTISTTVTLPATPSELAPSFLIISTQRHRRQHRFTPLSRFSVVDSLAAAAALHDMRSRNMPSPALYLVPSPTRPSHKLIWSDGRHTSHTRYPDRGDCIPGSDQRGGVRFARHTASIHPPILSH